MDRKIVSTFLSLAAIQGSNYVLPLLTFPYLIRVVGVHGFGLLSFSQAVTQYFMLVVDFGFALTAARAVAAHREDKRAMSEVFWSTMWAKTLLLVGCAAVLFVLSLVVPAVAEVASLVYPLFLTVLAAVLLPTFLFQGVERMPVVTMATISTKLLYVPLVYLFVHGPEDVVVAAWLQGLTTLLASFIAIGFIYRERLVVWHRTSWNEVRSTIAGSWTIFLSQAGVNLYTTSTLVLLRLFTDPTTVGVFAGADRIRQAASGVNTVLTNTFYPRLAAVTARSRAEALLFIGKIRKLQLAVGFVMSAIVFIFAPLIVRILLGPELDAAVPVLRIFAILSPLIALSHTYGIYGLINSGLNAAFMKVTLACGAVSLSIVPPLAIHFGAPGVAVATVITEALVFLGLYFYARRHGVFKPQDQ